MSRSIEDRLNELMDRMTEEIAQLSAQYPDEDYHGRFYWCEGCASIDAVAAPLADLIAGYPCPSCGRPQEPMVPPGLPEALTVSRADRRAGERSRRRAARRSARRS